MTIEELMYYGRYYDFEYEGYHLWWFDPYGGGIHQFNELINGFGYSSEQDIISSKKFIPLFETNIVKLEREFIKQCNIGIEQLENSEDMDFDTKFKMFVENDNLLDSWRSFEYHRLYQDAIIWCNENHIGNNIIVR